MKKLISRLVNSKPVNLIKQKHMPAVDEQERKIFQQKMAMLNAASKEYSTIH